MNGVRSALRNATRPWLSANGLGSSALATSSRVTIEAHRLISSSFLCRDEVAKTPESGLVPQDGSIVQSTGSVDPAHKHQEQRATDGPGGGPRWAVEDHQVEGGTTLSLDQQKTLEKTAQEGIASFEKTLFDMRQMPDLVDDLHEEDMLAETAALWAQLQPLKAIAWAAEIIGHEKEAKSMIRPYVEKLMKDYLTLPDPKPLTAALLGLITGFPGKIPGDRKHDDDELDPLTVLTVVLVHIQKGGKMSPALSERVARFYLNTASRTQARIARLQDPDAQFALRWRRSPIDAAFAVILKALQLAGLRLSNQTVAGLMELTGRRNRGDAALQAVDVQERAATTKATRSRANHGIPMHASQRFGNNQGEASSTGSPLKMRSPGWSPAFVAVERPTATPTASILDGLQPLSEGSKQTASTPDSQAPFVWAEGMTPDGGLELPIKDPYLPLVDAILATRESRGRHATWDRILPALPKQLIVALRANGISHETYVLAAQNGGHVLLRRDQQNRDLICLDDEAGRSLAPRRPPFVSRREPPPRFTWSSLAAIMRYGTIRDYTISARSLARHLPAERAWLYQRAAGAADLDGFVAAAQASRILERLPGDQRSPYYLRLHEDVLAEGLPSPMKSKGQRTRPPERRKVSNQRPLVDGHEETNELQSDLSSTQEHVAMS